MVPFFKRRSFVKIQILHVRSACSTCCCTNIKWAGPCMKLNFDYQHFNSETIENFFSPNLALSRAIFWACLCRIGGHYDCGAGFANDSSLQKNLEVGSCFSSFCDCFHSFTCFCMNYTVTASSIRFPPTPSNKVTSLRKLSPLSFEAEDSNRYHFLHFPFLPAGRYCFIIVS